MKPEPMLLAAAVDVLVRCFLGAFRFLFLITSTTTTALARTEGKGREWNF
jgi:hypothetical protein